MAKSVAPTLPPCLLILLAVGSNVVLVESESVNVDVRNTFENTSYHLLARDQKDLFKSCYKSSIANVFSLTPDRDIHISKIQEPSTEVYARVSTPTLTDAEGLAALIEKRPDLIFSDLNGFNVTTYGLPTNSKAEIRKEKKKDKTNNEDKVLIATMVAIFGVSGLIIAGLSYIYFIMNNEFVRIHPEGASEEELGTASPFEEKSFAGFDQARLGSTSEDSPKKRNATGSHIHPFSKSAR
mmetsp:Transcript_19972/g.31737  ORF Transcript_19972/g.31737 Transcript_19972/m.31737 type:complete len:239 (+) Transcript_19972:127-843(+)|eukprot:jgi/Bigna1/71356/fgenesh1_pg.15_\